MALNAAWWSTDYETVRYVPSMTGIAFSLVTFGDAWRMQHCIPVSSGSPLTNMVSASILGATNRSDLGFGFFYGKHAVGGAPFYFPYVILHNLTGVPTSPSLTTELPKVNIDGTTPSYTAIVQYFGSTVASYTGIHLYYKYVDGTKTVNIWHYQPYAWYANVARVMSAILMKAGLSSSYVDTVLWSAADTAQSALTNPPVVCFVRPSGETVVESLKRIAQHSNDIFGINMEGKITLVSRTAPPTSTFTVPASRALDKVTWRYAFEYLANYCRASHGIWLYQQVPAVILAEPPVTNTTSPDHVNFRATAQIDTSCEVPVNGEMFDVYEDTASQTKYGVRDVGTQKNITIEAGLQVTRTQYHFPYFYEVLRKTQTMARLAAVECRLRRLITVVQNLEGLDYDIGYKVDCTNLIPVTPAITDARCIRKRLDFREMKITSWLLEE